MKDKLTWACEICGERYEDEMIDVYTHDMSEEHGLPAGTIQRNVTHCYKTECLQEAQNKKRWEW